MSVLNIVSATITDKMVCCGESSEFELGATYAVSDYLERKRINPPSQSDRLRTIFNDTPLVHMKPVSNHTHGVSAAARSTASLFIDRLSRISGMNVIFYQGSAADVRNNRTISRNYHWTKDIGVPSLPYSPSVEDMVAMVDVDYYVDMPKFLMGNFRPIILYTFQPSSVAKCEGEYKYTFNKSGEVEYTVSGGGSYTHKVWNYDGDSLCVVKKFCGVVYEMATFLVERKYVDQDHQLVLIVPTGKFKGTAGWFANRNLHGRCLARLNPVVGDYLRLKTNTKTDIMLHTGKVGAYSKSSISAHLDDELASMAKMSKVGLTLPMVKGKLKELDLKGVELLHEFHALQLNPKPQQLSLPDPNVRGYQWIDDCDYEQDAKQGLVSFMKPLYDGAFAPDMTKGNDSRAVRKRVVEVRTKTQLTPFLIKVVDEYVSLLLRGVEGNLHPVTYDEVYERQNRPTQRRILESSLFEEPERKCKSFVKREAYADVNDPRMISTINGVDKREYSAYTYALSDVLKEQEWYAFSKTPVEQANRVASILVDAVEAGMTDFSRMDGRKSEVLRYLEETLMVRAFHKMYTSDLLDRMRAQRNLPARTRHGVVYRTKEEQLSGSADTSLVNTVDNSFTAYLSFRMTPTSNGYMTPKQSWNSLGIYGGDDGLTANAVKKIYEKAATMVGQKLTIDMLERGAAGIKFLARCYGPDVWFGDNNSCCDFKRMLAKFHTTVHMPSTITRVEKLRDKAHALWLNDRNTPLVSKFTERVRYLFGAVGKNEFRNLSNQYSWALGDVNYPNEYAQWMLDLIQDQLPNFDFVAFNCWCEVATKDTIFDPPAFDFPAPAKMKDGLVVVDNDIFLNGSSLIEALPKAEPERKFRQRKKKRDRQSRLDGARPKLGGTPLKTDKTFRKKRTVS